MIAAANRGIERRLIFWQNMVSLHQASMLRALAERPNISVTLVVDGDIEDWRINAGWNVPDLGPVELVRNPSAALIRNYFSDSSGSTVHFISGIGAYPAATRALNAAFRSKVLQAGTTPAVVAVFEQWDGSGIRGRVRSLLYRFRLSLYRRALDAILLIGDSKRAQVARWCGPSVQVYRYAYFVESRQNTTDHGPSPAPSLVFVGRLVALKRLDLLLQALSGLKESEWHLRVIGEGPCRSEWEACASDLGLADRVTWEGPRSNQEVRDLLSREDLLILPSDYDGWGAVVNEGLHAGCRVIVSDAAGASALVNVQTGSCFTSGSSDSLRNAVAAELAKAPMSRDDRERVAAWADASVSPRVGASYVCEISSAVLAPGAEITPRVPWVAASD